MIRDAARDGVERGGDVLQLEVSELLLHRVDGADQQQHAEHRRQVAQVVHQAAGCWQTGHSDQAASAGRVSAASISAIVSATPYRAMKPPKRGPSCWPSSTWYRQANQARSSGNGWRLPTS